MKFQHGINEKEAREYLKDIGVYEQIIKSAKENVFGNNYPKNDGFMVVIAANDEYEKRNKQTEVK